MKTRSLSNPWVVLMILCPLAAGPVAASTCGDAAGAIAEASRRWEAAYARGDAEGLAEVYAEDAQILAPNEQVIEGRSAIAAFFP